MADSVLQRRPAVCLPASQRSLGGNFQPRYARSSGKGLAQAMSRAIVESVCMKWKKDPAGTFRDNGSGKDSSVRGGWSHGRTLVYA